MSPPSIRHAVERDASAVQQLMAALGYPDPEEDLRARIATFTESHGDELLVAVVHDEVVGLVAVNMAPLFAEGGMFARITALVVSEDHRHSGIGRSLVLEAERRAIAAGCALMQVNSGRRPERAEAHRFYRALGYADASKHHAHYEKDLDAGHV
jgi:ribosomal protein S18 acetylase RimI-like enzyme